VALAGSPLGGAEPTIGIATDSRDVQWLLAWQLPQPSQWSSVPKSWMPSLKAPPTRTLPTVGQQVLGVTSSDGTRCPGPRAAVPIGLLARGHFAGTGRA